MRGHLADYYSRPIEIVDGDGCFLVDAKGKRYLDFIAGWCVGNIGWKRKEVREALQKEAARGIYVPPFLHFAGWEKFAELLVSHAPGKLSRVFRCTSGSEAVEFAVKCARAATGKKFIVSIDGVYHGHTYGAASVGNACSKEMAPCLFEFEKIPMPNEYRGVTAAEVVKKFEKRAREGDIAAFISEPVFTNAGAIVPPADFYPAIADICRKHGILLVMDEVATGFGRCGTLFGSELWGLEPDIICLGKGLTGGYGTMGATLVTEKVYARASGIPWYSTFGWLVTDLAAAQANVEVILRERLWENAREVGAYILEKLKPLEDTPDVGEVRGIGMVLGIEIVRDKQSRAPDFLKAQRFQDRCAERGLLLETAHNTLFITPSLTLTKELADQGIGIISEVLRAG
ncbi:MAG: aspartate aminotransferase family protein [Patescibacteria group bacterium]|mgnify:CR=1 FL=1